MKVRHKIRAFKRWMEVARLDEGVAGLLGLLLQLVGDQGRLPLRRIQEVLEQFGAGRGGGLAHEPTTQLTWQQAMQSCRWISTANTRPKKTLHLPQIQTAVSIP